MKSYVTRNNEYNENDKILDVLETELEFLSEVPEGANKKVTIVIEKDKKDDYHFEGKFKLSIFTE